jgi:hypothetical protein
MRLSEESRLVTRPAGFGGPDMWPGLVTAADLHSCAGVGWVPTERSVMAGIRLRHRRCREVSTENERRGHCAVENVEHARL